MRFSLDARPENEILSDIKELTQSPGYVHALAHTSWRDNFIFYAGEITPEDMANSYAPNRLLRTELNTLLGFMIQEPVATTLPDPTVTQEYLDRTERLMEELHASFNKPMMEIFTPERLKSGVRPFHQADILREPIFYRGESAFHFQYSEFAVERYRQDDKWLKDNVGFTSSDMRQFEHAVSRIQHQKMMEKMASLPATHPRLWSFLDVFSFTIADLEGACSLEARTLESFLSAFSLTPGNINHQFNEIGDFNLVNAKPIIALNDKTFLSLQFYALCEALYDSPFYWMLEDKEYRSTAQANRGRFTEQIVADRLAEVFGKSNVFRNVNLERGRSNRAGEIDVFVKFGDRALVIQCKSKKLTLEARKGNDGQLKSDFKKAIQESYDQALGCSEHIKRKDIRLVSSEGEEIEIVDFNEIYPFCITSENYPALTVQAREILKYKNDDEIIQLPFVADVFLIDVICEFLTSPLYFLSYVNRRVNYHERLTVVSEFTILGFHLKSNLWIDDDTHLLALDDSMGIDLDTAFTIRRRGIPGKATPEGILTRLKTTYVGRLLAAIERSSEPPLIDLGFALLKLSEETFAVIENGVTQICKQTERDSRLHDFTVTFGDQTEGLTVHCGIGSSPESAQKLFDHCERRKYASKANQWFGLSVRHTDGMPKFGVNLKSRWKPDERLRETTKGMNMMGNLRLVGRQLKRIKVGRNEPCPCGSGIKYKKCCLKNG
ncbi:SEC-C metal-binding domain-containing protein [Qipengyuania sp. MTN3-11]|uniref:SEC-C metal-binding domain-containing protein n=1 Tax=Qipengyuania sp. MTN3-11 TaxID=3056557 RepID=UPI0036F24D88